MKQPPVSADAYSKLVSEFTPPSRHLRGCLRAFWVGGLICAIGQALNLLGNALELSETTGPMFTTVVLIFLGTTLTGLGVYDRIGKYAGAGSIVPITGFANSVAAPAIEYQREGAIMGVGARIFQLAGPVLSYGIAASMLIGMLYCLLKGWLL